MTEKNAANDPSVEISELKTRAEAAEGQVRDLEEVVETQNTIIGDYQQNLADAQMAAATFKAKFMNAQRKLNAAAGAQ
jgi:chromosome segregation ATPase